MNAANNARKDWQGLKVKITIKSDANVSRGYELFSIYHKN